MDLYQRKGFKTWKPANASRCVGPGRFISASQDILDAFDFVAVNKDEIHMVQVKSNESHASEARTLIDTIEMPKEVLRVVMCRIPGKPYHFKIWISRGGGVWGKDDVCNDDW